MKIYQSWKRNAPTTDGYSLTITYIYSSKYLHEIEDIERKLPNGTIIMDTDKTENIPIGTGKSVKQDALDNSKRRTAEATNV